MLKVLAALGLTKGLAITLAVVLAVAGTAAGAYVVSTNRAIEARDRQIADLGKKLEATVQVIDQRDLQRLKELTILQGQNAALVSEVAGVRDTMRVLASVRPGETRVERITERISSGVPGPPGTSGTAVAGAAGRDGRDGTAGTPGAAGSTPGTGPPTGPIITPAEAPAAREKALEQIIVDFVPGSLLNCDTVGLEPNQVELLRDPTGRLASTAKCVFRVTDRIRLQAPPPIVTIAASRWLRRVYLGYGSTDGLLIGARATYKLWRGFDIEGQGECRQNPGAPPAAPRPLGISCNTLDGRVTIGYSW